MKPMKPMKPMAPMAPMEPMTQNAWWPRAWGSPNSSGGQNDLQYAYFAEPQRLAVKRQDKITFYDTGGRHISGMSQSQSGDDGDAVFSTADGVVHLDDLKIVQA